MDLPVVIAGAGIGGLSAALALGAGGHDVLVVEKADELAEVGAGLQLSPNACRVLDDLGVLDSLMPHAVAPGGIRIGSGRTGREIVKIELGERIAARHGAPYLVVHRADLQKALFDRALHQGRIDIRLGSEILEVGDTPDGTLQCHVRSGGVIAQITARALIGADGVWSRVRERVSGHAQAKYTGLTAYRATLPAEKVNGDLLADTGLWLGPDAHLVHYPIRAGREFNLVALVPEKWTEEGWSATADRETLLGHFRAWAPNVRSLLEKPDTWLKWALCGVDAEGPWSDGRIALLGDAAHAMLPFAAQGAAMAIEDAAVLAHLFPRSATDIRAVFRAYEAARKRRVKKVQKTAAENGRIYHLGGPLAVGRDTVMKLMRPDRLSARQDWIYGWTPPR
ncbi:FAD-dependent monooxygenase [Roseibium aggregatum]|uniref:Monooxygenase n=1 Tax=Roseibium aggregatum TaxID=187304 RepID=A0A926S7D1_9HYPH|nr:FAD-dependent monooxygenase [Roseibium aggregatum]MBD1548155.1 monooxygenase [Roseibium aggregatum]